MEQVTISIPLAEQLIRTKGQGLVQNHIDQLWALLPEDLKDDIMEVLSRMIKEQDITVSNILGALYGAVECMALHWEGKL